jgi:quinol monooxygenase YgiN
MSVGMVRLTVTLRPAARCVQEVVAAFRFLMVGTRLEPGCLGCSVWAEPDSTVHYVEEWTTEADLRRRVASDGFTSVLSLVEAAQEPPRVRFDFVSSTRGLEYVAEVRHPEAGKDRGGPLDPQQRGRQ